MCNVIILGKGKPITPALCEIHYQAEKEAKELEAALKQAYSLKGGNQNA